MGKIWAERHKQGRWCDGKAKNSIFTEKVIGVLTTTIRHFQKHNLRSPLGRQSGVTGLT
ncbi:hypothetical protein DPMN_101186 [Dreissena polymorpha]|uniref:Uncharacterized protein n=1 Tax=Dreissena polymorpha TaxID=45954 RepID=A0A9D4LIN1_DREPO|nr:hypothetical protein DPMN_182501 [Dreissena polymorpha]KAH3858559.1 hypothetical protein DPMN_101186 [Dreissena polymorpha]